ncbi:MAG: DUF2927 domain-containing protein [Pseudomonadota bacterium]
MAGLLALAACGPRYSPDYWVAYEANLQLDGKLRTERAPADAPFDRSDLALHFSKTAFGLDPEFLKDLDEEARADINVIRRWGGPIRYAVYGILGETDRIALAEVTERISRASGIAMTPTRDPAAADWNLGIYVFGYDERRAFLDHLRGDGDEALHALFAGLFSDEVICSGTMLRRTDESGNLTAEFGHALVFIRAELPDTLRRSCIEEELAQGMGLIRDDDGVRPSLFNEDEEFALMTLHDEMLMRILYDPRLKPGMTKEEAMPIVHRIAAELDLPSRF